VSFPKKEKIVMLGFAFHRRRRRKHATSPNHHHPILNRLKFQISLSPPYFGTNYGETRESRK
jgi:hypothetical protein